MKGYKFKNWKGIFKISKDRGAPQQFLLSFYNFGNKCFNVSLSLVGKRG